MRGTTVLVWSPLLWAALVSFFAALTLARVEQIQDSTHSVSSLARKNFAYNVENGFSKRQADLEKIRERGHKMWCLMGASRDDVKKAEGRDLESPAILKTDGIERLEGWDREDEEEDVSVQYSLRKAFDDLDISKDGQALRMRTKRWFNEQTGIISPEYKDGIPVGMPKRGFPTGAKFVCSFVVSKGVLVAEDILSVPAALEASEKTVDEIKNDGMEVTNIRHFNDAIWMQWVQACKEDNGDKGSINYIVHTSVINDDSLQTIKEVVLEKWPDDPGVGTWDSDKRRTFTKNDNLRELQALLGTPNGASTARVLISHKEDLGVKVIDQVDIFVDEDEWNVNEQLDGYSVMMLFMVSDLDSDSDIEMGDGD